MRLAIKKSFNLWEFPRKPFDTIIQFSRLEHRDDQERGSTKFSPELQAQLSDKRVQLEASEAARKLAEAYGHDVQSGVNHWRGLSRTADQVPLSRDWLSLAGVTAAWVASTEARRATLSSRSRRRYRLA